MAAMLLLMVTALQHGYDTIAGICWALIMTKPQMGLLFSIPLLWYKKYKTVFVAIFVCKRKAY